MRRGRELLLLVGLLALGPGCRSVGESANGAYEWGAQVFAANPVAHAPYGLGWGLGVFAGLPLSLISWPLTLWLYPDEDHGEFSLSASLSPSLYLGTGLGTLLGAPFAPFGWPWVPDLPPDPPEEP